MIRVRDRDEMKESFWEPMRFLNWIHQLREHELESSMKELRDPNDKWEPFEESEVLVDSLCNSRISVNLTPVKKQMNESLHQLSVDASFLDNSIDQTTESVLQKRREDIQQCLIQMELASKTLRALCNQYETKNVSGKVGKALEKVNAIIYDVKSILDDRSIVTDQNISELDNVTFDQTEMDDEVKKFTPNFDSGPPAKSNLKNACPFLKNENEMKSVKFDI